MYQENWRYIWMVSKIVQWNFDQGRILSSFEAVASIENYVFIRAARRKQVVLAYKPKNQLSYPVLLYPSLSNRFEILLTICFSIIT